MSELFLQKVSLKWHTFPFHFTSTTNNVLIWISWSCWQVLSINCFKILKLIELEYALWRPRLLVKHCHHFTIMLLYEFGSFSRLHFSISLPFSTSSSDLHYAFAVNKFSTPSCTSTLRIFLMKRNERNASNAGWIVHAISFQKLCCEDISGDIQVLLLLL